MGWCSKCTRLFCFVFDLEKNKKCINPLVSTRKPKTWTWKNCTQSKLKYQYPFVTPNWPNPTFCYSTSTLLLLTTVSFMNSNHHHLHQFIVFFLSALPPISNLSLIALRSAPQEVLKYACMKAIFSWNGTSENCHYLYNMYYTHMQTYK